MPVQSRPYEERAQQRVSRYLLSLRHIYIEIANGFRSYIKELAERLNTLESQMQPPMAQQDMQYQGMSEISPPRGYHEFSPPIDGNLLGRKRTFSMSEGIHGLPLTQPPFTPRGQATVGKI